MSSHKQIYRNQADAYEYMIGRQPEVLPWIEEIRPVEGLDILDLGAGSGRIAGVVADRAKSLVCTDASAQMLELLNRKLTAKGTARTWRTIEADHRKLPIPDRSVDLAVSGWSICYLADSDLEEWERNLKTVMAELERVLRPGGTIIVFETMGTGTETPDPPGFLTSYYEALERDYGFGHRTVRMDYDFADVEEAKACTGFFFGEELTEKIERNGWATVPECAGIWWKTIGEA
ncbi:class I SAM-dependent methyltransferase [Saccharibacillus alkalitolerans]|uniref:Class I SAM-dependent methyltransferase n=1 Tax=Saccharibacillus alkalitolerans TaxID=2705290 RepID=A0ABX0F9R4_9BACL|nr:class I SAM-dependent methyltransferase [Saccharibacillus alkalitolerans]NGZ77678.1 class I SAM-dependent methyltransferase [Saccharibacillus alkalitolerans]